MERTALEQISMLQLMDNAMPSFTTPRAVNMWVKDFTPPVISSCHLLAPHTQCQPCPREVTLSCMCFDISDRVFGVCQQPWKSTQFADVVLTQHGGNAEMPFGLQARARIACALSSCQPSSQLSQLPRAEAASDQSVVSAEHSSGCCAKDNNTSVPAELMEAPWWLIQWPKQTLISLENTTQINPE
ncbi:hypothetical protein TURU_096368 [Turdus rufiventris]|nr:hypothetical protein TURU_096368 [Turdus rufiventris]